jgi:hypothetical protein
MTIELEGDDCDNSFGSRWTKYWTAITDGLGNYGYDTPTLAITLRVVKDARTVTTVISPDGSKIEFTVPRDVEPAGWDGAFAKPFRQRKSGFMKDFSYALMLDTDPLRAKILDKLFDLRVGPACLAKLPVKDSKARHTFSFTTRYVLEYGKAVTGDDWDAIFSQSGDAEMNKATAFGMIDDFKKRFSFVVAIEGKDCDNTHDALWQRYVNTIAQAMQNNPPKAKKVTITLNMSAKAKDITVKAAKDGSTITFTAPMTLEPKAWSDKLAAPFAKFPKKSN